MEVQQGVAFAHAAARVGAELPVVIDGPDPEFANHFAGRTTADAPDIDCGIRVKGKNLKAGDLVTAIKGGKHWGDLVGRAVGKTPTGVSGIQPGDLVRVKSRAEIELTLNAELLNRGMGFDSEMARFCGRTARVARKVDHIIDEHSGKMLVMRSPCLVLEDIICEGVLHANCPRSITPYWREIWLDKVTPELAGER